MSSKTAITSVNIKAYARLHMGFFDLNGSQGRRFGSMGVSLNQPVTALHLSKCSGEFTTDDKVLGSTFLPEYIEKTKRQILAHLKIADDVEIRVESAIPRHAGLGSGTQMALAVGVGISQLFNKPMTLAEIASLTQRGQRSGIGIGTFGNGGFVVDGGRGYNTSLPPIIAQHAVPSTWRFLLVFEPAFTGVNGAEEMSAFSTLQDQGLENTQAITHQVLTKAMPAILEQDATAFGEVVNQLQAYNGDYFAPAQGGQYASQAVTAALAHLNSLGAACVGQSSWGPTGFAMFDNVSQAEKSLAAMQEKLGDSNLQLMLCEPCNHGARITTNA